jgi:hypothetical protein
MRRAAAAAGFDIVRIASDSTVYARRGDGRIGVKRALLSATMLALAPIVDPPARGIILLAFLRKP